MLYLLLAIFAPMFARYDFAAQNAKAMNKWPSLEHIFGTDPFGRDLFCFLVQISYINIRKEQINSKPMHHQPTHMSHTN